MTTATMTALRAFAASLLLAALPTLAVAQAPAPESLPAPEAKAATPGSGEFEGLPEAARAALDQGRVVLLETVNEEKTLATKLVAVVEGRPADVVDALRDYDAMAAYPEVRKVSAQKGEDRDTFQLTVKPHPLLPPMDFSKAVEWSLDGEGSATVGMSLLSTTSDYIADQQASYRILPLDDERSLVFYETRSVYAKLSFRQRVLRRTQESAERWMEDLRDRAAERGRHQPAGAGAVALLSSHGAAAPLK